MSCIFRNCTRCARLDWPLTFPLVLHHASLPLNFSLSLFLFRTTVEFHIYTTPARQGINLTLWLTSCDRSLHAAASSCTATQKRALDWQELWGVYSHTVTTDTTIASLFNRFLVKEGLWCILKEPHTQTRKFQELSLRSTQVRENVSKTVTWRWSTDSCVSERISRKKKLGLPSIK